MKVSGSYIVPVPPGRAYDLLQDPVVLAKCMPGCEGLDKTGEDEYAMRMKMLLGSMSGLFAGKVKISDANRPSSFRLNVSGNGKIGFMNGEGLLTLTPEGNGTSVRYEGDVQVGGTLAAVGQRLIDTTSRMMIKRFFEKLGKEATATSNAAD